MLQTIPLAAWLVFCGSPSQAQTATSPPSAAQDGEVTHFGTVVFSSGFEGTIYYLHHGTWHLPDFTKLKPKGTIYTPVLNVPPQQFSLGFPGLSRRFEWFGISYSTHFWVKDAGAYQFSLLADDAADLYIDDRLVIDNDGQHPPQTKEGVVVLASGMHQMRVPYYQGPKWQVALVLKVQGPTEKAPHVFDTEAFKPPADAGR